MSGFDPTDAPSILGGGPVPLGGGYKSPKKKGSGGAIALIGLAVLIVGAVAAVLVLTLSGKTSSISLDPSNLPPKRSSSAAAHLPSGCDVVMHVNWAKMLELPAVKTHLLPLLEANERSANKNSKAVAELIQKVGLDRQNDLKDIGACVVGLTAPRSQQKFVIVVGGELRPETLIPALTQVDIRHTTSVDVSKKNGRYLAKLTATDGSVFSMSQAEDGALIIANDDGLFEAATPTGSSKLRDYALSETAEASFALSAEAFRKAVGTAGATPFTKDLNDVTRLVATASFKEPLVEVRVSTASPQAAKSLADIYALILGPMIKSEISRVRGSLPFAPMLMNAKAEAVGNDLVVSAKGSPEDVEAAVKQLVQLIEQRTKAL